MFCEYYSLILRGRQDRRALEVEQHSECFSTSSPGSPWAPAFFFVFFHLFFTGKIGAGIALRDRPIFRAFRLAKVWQYGAVIAMRAPLVIAAGIGLFMPLWP